ncbi:hypothetical protein [Aurantimicrobium minutum]|uniref:hypothetical protein n=1 Tax=Aurantimicrobium minutum TaxID=708131 RepID=UPI002474E4E0|nr:hypothetical protein [Aurantimicrobium minutum]MDH6423406.1 hypothetical protein [Aurantimicrobium minutum]
MTTEPTSENEEIELDDDALEIASGGSSGEIFPGGSQSQPSNPVSFNPGLPSVTAPVTNFAPHHMDLIQPGPTLSPHGPVG